MVNFLEILSGWSVISKLWNQNLKLHTIKWIKTYFVCGTLHKWIKTVKSGESRTVELAISCHLQIPASKLITKCSLHFCPSLPNDGVNVCLLNPVESRPGSGGHFHLVKKFEGLIHSQTSQHGEGADLHIQGACSALKRNIYWKSSGRHFYSQW